MTMCIMLRLITTGVTSALDHSVRVELLLGGETMRALFLAGSSHVRRLHVLPK
jgi:hypothetical protein